jgi:hypothetical protein
MPDHLGTDAAGGNGDLLDEILVGSARALEGEGLLDDHIGLAAGLALRRVLDRLAVGLFEGTLVNEFFIASAFGGLGQINLGDVSGIVHIEGVAFLSLLSQTARDGIVLLGAALSAGQLEASGHKLAVRDDAAVRGLEFAMSLLVVVTTKTASATAQVLRSGQFNMGSLDLDVNVQVCIHLHDNAVLDGVNNSLNGLVVPVADLESGVLIKGLDSGLSSVNGNVTGGVQLNGIISVDDLNNLVLAFLASQNDNVGLLGAVGHQNMLALVNSVVVQTAIVGENGLGTHEALVLGCSSKSQVNSFAGDAVTSLQGVKSFEIGKGKGREGLVIFTNVYVVGNDSFSRADDGPVAGASEGIALNSPGGTVRGVRIVSMLNGEVVNNVGDPVADPVSDLGDGSGQVVGFGGQFVVVVSLIQVAGLFAIGASVHETLSHILLAFLSNGAVHGVLGSIFITEKLGLEANLRLIAVLTETNGFVVGHIQNILAKSVMGSLVPVADGVPANGVVYPLVGIGGAWPGGGVLFDAEVSKVLAVPGVSGTGKGSVKVDVRSILLLNGETSPDEVGISTFQALEDTLKSGLEFGNNWAGRENFGGRALVELILSRLDDNSMVAALEGSLVLEPGLNSAGLGTFGLIPEVVLAVLDFERNKAKVRDTVDVPFLEHMKVGGEVSEIELALGDKVNINTITFAQRNLTVDRGFLDRDDVVGLLILESGFVAVGDVAGNGVGLDVVIEKVGNLASRSPSNLNHAVLDVVVEFLGKASLNTDIDSGSNVVTVEGQFDTELG